jgi:heptosyltransferase-2
MRILIVKKGALGDVVRTSYFAGALRRKHGSELQLHWLTSRQALPLLQHNPHMDFVTDRIEDLRNVVYDRIFSLDDEGEILEEVRLLSSSKLTGAYLDSAGQATYTHDSAEWFDMGLLSKLGKKKADRIKRQNTRSHAEIFSDIFGVSDVAPEFFNGTQNRLSGPVERDDKRKKIGINPFAGGRWKSKQLRANELQRLVEVLLAANSCIEISLIGGGVDYESNCRLADSFENRRVRAVFTDDRVLQLANAIGGLDLLITSDSLALHLAVAQNIPFVAFFAPTSAAEIDTFGRGIKVISTASDYCSYRSDADNSSITAERLLSAALKVLSTDLASPEAALAS